MKTLKILTACIVVLSGISVYSQSSNKLQADIVLKDLSGNEVNISKIDNKGKPIVISFWATWCKSCKEELNAIDKVFDKWQSETGVILIAVSIDDSRSMKRVKPFVEAQGWKYAILLDPTSKLKKGMNVLNLPHTFLVDGKGNIVWDHNNYKEGDEKELYKELLKIK